MSGRRRRPASFAQSVATRLRASEPADLLAVVPYLLGFHPSESVVMVFVRSGRVLLTARVDLPPPGHADDLAAELSGLARQHQVVDAVAIVYSSDPVRARRILQGLIGGVTGLSLSEAIFVDGERWWSLLCSPPCCPTEGRPYDVGTHRLAAEAVYAGLAVRSDRSELETLVAGPDVKDAARLERRASSLAAEIEALTAEQAAKLVETTVHAVLIDGAVLDEAARLRLAMLIIDLRLRDLAWASITRENARAQVDLWTEVVALTPSPLAAAPLCLLGLAAWVAGDGALLNCCVERVRQLHPGYSLGSLLADISARALPPSVWDELVDDLRAELGLVPG